MQLIELFEDRVNMPHLFLDMDGVQADFFGAWAERHGVSHYKAIGDRDKSMNELAHSSPEEVYSFFRDLKPLSGGIKIISWLRSHKIPFTVLSAPLRGPHSIASIEAKQDWLDQYNPGTSNHAIFTSTKQKYALNGDLQNVLVDDYGKYLSAWSDAGGIAVKYEDRNADQTIRDLETIYKPFLNAH